MNCNNDCFYPFNKAIPCSCKDGMLCALDWFFQDFLLKPSGNNKIESLFYYPKFPTVSNTIYNIPYLTNDIVPVYIDPYNTNNPGDDKTAYNGDIAYLNICKLDGFKFTLKPDKTSVESDIQTRFSKIKYCQPSANCCKNGILESLLKARDFLESPYSVTISNNSGDFVITSILAVNSDTVWAKFNGEVDGEVVVCYYVFSNCEIIGITLDKVVVDEGNEENEG